jgi:hypothetical protein
MDLNAARNFLMWCTIVNYTLLIVWCFLFCCLHDRFVRLNEMMFGRKIPAIDTVNYAGIALYKIGIILFNLVPWVVLTFAS